MVIFAQIFILSLYGRIVRHTRCNQLKFASYIYKDVSYG